MTGGQDPGTAAEPVQTLPDCIVRDGYGFQLSQSSIPLHAVYAPIWDAQEQDREASWMAFLVDHTVSAGCSIDLATVAKQRLPQVMASITALAISRQNADEQHADMFSTASPPYPEVAPDGDDASELRLRSLVEGGVPAEMRGVAWAAFLGVHRRRVPGYYQQLVDVALGVLQTRTTITPDELREQATASAALLSSIGGPGDAAAALARPPAQGPSHHPRGSVSASSSSNNLAARCGPQGLGGSAMAHTDSCGDLSSSAMPALGRSADLLAGVNHAAWSSSGRVWLQQIEKDLPRTFPGLRLPEDGGWSDTAAPASLRKVLAAYALHNAQVGYCQGLNFITGCLMQFMSQESAFYCLCAIVEEVLPGYYATDMLATQVDQRVFLRLMTEQAPALTSHLKALGGTDILDAVFAQWFLCAFVNALPMETCLRVWDLLFLHCSSGVLFAAALALLEVFAPALMATTDVLDAFGLVQSLPSLMFDSSRLVTTMCSGFGHLLQGAELEHMRAEAKAEVLAEREADEAARAQADAERRQEAEPPSRMAMVKKFLQQMPFLDKDDKDKPLVSGSRRERPQSAERPAHQLDKPPTHPPAAADKSALAALSNLMPSFLPQPAVATSGHPVEAGQHHARQSLPMAVPSSTRSSAQQPLQHHQDDHEVAGRTSGHHFVELSPCQSVSPVMVRLDSARSASPTPGDAMGLHGGALAGRKDVRDVSHVLVDDVVHCSTEQEVDDRLMACLAGDRGPLSSSTATAPAASSLSTALNQAAAADAGRAAAASHAPRPPPSGRMSPVGTCGEDGETVAPGSAVRRVPQKRSAAAELAMQIASKPWHTAMWATEHPALADGAPRPGAAGTWASGTTPPEPPEHDASPASGFNLVQHHEARQQAAHAETLRDEWVDVGSAQPPAAPFQRQPQVAPTCTSYDSDSTGVMAGGTARDGGASLLSRAVKGGVFSSTQPTAVAVSVSSTTSSTPHKGVYSALDAGSVNCSTDGMDMPSARGLGEAGDADSVASSSAAEPFVASMRPDEDAVKRLAAELGLDDLWGHWQTLSQVYLQVRGESSQSAIAGAMERLAQLEALVASASADGGDSSAVEPQVEQQVDASCLQQADAQPQQAQMQQLIGQLRVELYGATQQQQQQTSTMDALNAFAEECVTKFQGAAVLLAERDKLNSVLSFQVTKLTADVASQDSQIADREEVILRQRLGASGGGDSFSRGRPTSSDSSQAFEGAGGGAGGEGGRWTKLFKGGFKAFGKEDVVTPGLNGKERG